MALYVVNGLFKRLPPNPKSTIGLTEFRKIAKEQLDALNVPYVDTCCLDDLTTFTVRANTAGDNTLEYFNGTAWTNFAFDATLADIVATSLSTDTITEKTAAAGVTIDGALVKDGGLSNSAGTQIAGFFPTVAAQALSGAGAVNVTSYLTEFTSSGASQALTIASGTQIGQRKKVVHVVDGGSGVLTGVFVGGTNITFTTVAEFADLMWTGSAWAVLELGNSAVPGTPPVLA